MIYHSPLLTNIVAVLHPKYKDVYFTKAKWEPTWVQTAHRVLREHWETYYKPKIHPSFLENTSLSEDTVGLDLSSICVKLMILRRLMTCLPRLIILVGPTPKMH